MIVEINTIDEFQELCAQFFDKNHNKFWQSRSSKVIGVYDLNSISAFIQNFFYENLTNPTKALPYLKIWANIEKLNYTCVGVFIATRCRMTNQKVFEDLIWQGKGKLATKLIEKKNLINILNRAEFFAKENCFDSFRLTRDMERHHTGDPKFKNFYTNSGFSPSVITYVKKLN